MSWAALAGGLNQVVVRQFGEATTYTTQVGQAGTVRGVFDEAHVLVEAGEADVSSVGPAVFYRLSDLPVDPLEDEPEIVIRGVSYEVREARKDGQGGVLLLLRKVVT
jgi:hypothetical protein